MHHNKQFLQQQVWIAEGTKKRKQGTYQAIVFEFSWLYQVSQ